MTQSDIDFLFWHAVAKARVGRWDNAGAIFHVLEPFHEDAAIGRAYCLVRMGAYTDAASVLNMTKPTQGRALAIHKRLLRRCEKEMANAIK